MNKIKGYKVFNRNMSCRGFFYEVGKDYTHKGKIIPCEAGFHFCKKAVDCFNYYTFASDNRVCEVEGYGDIIEHEDKIVCSKIKIIRELSWDEVLRLVNTGKDSTGYKNSGNCNSGNWNSGNWNTGDWNSGNKNSGDFNSGDKNSGNRNSGNRNSGNWNTGSWNTGNWNTGNCNTGNWNSTNRETGYFNSVSSKKIRVFNKECSVEVWENAEKPQFIYKICLTKMEEGKLITYSYKEAWLNAWNKAKNKSDWEKEYKLLINLPNFDKKVFKEITGIDIEKEMDGDDLIR